MFHLKPIFFQYKQFSDQIVQLLLLQRNLKFIKEMNLPPGPPPIIARSKSFDANLYTKFFLNMNLLDKKKYFILILHKFFKIILNK
jgi:hypothetical protein